MSRRERQRARPAGAVSADGLVRGVTAVTGAPLLALLRVEADVAELVEALHDVAEAFAQRLAARDGDPS